MMVWVSGKVYHASIYIYIYMRGFEWLARQIMDKLLHLTNIYYYHASMKEGVPVGSKVDHATIYKRGFR